jgi:agmatinase
MIVSSEFEEPAYAGTTITYCRCAAAASEDDAAAADVTILGAPFDNGVTYRPGTRFGPRAIRLGEDAWAHAARPHMELGVDPFELLHIVDHGDIQVVPADLLRSQVSLREKLVRLLAGGTTPIVLGGDHSLALPTMQALAEHHGPHGFAVVQFDTHADTAEREFDADNSNGTPFYRAVAQGIVRGDQIVQIGLRGAWPGPEEFAWMRAQGFRWHTMEAIAEHGIGSVVRDAIAYAGAQAPRLYLSVDIDVLDPAFAPGTGTPEPGGLSSLELLRAVRAVASELSICAMDVVEVSPPYDTAGITATVAHRVVLEALSGIALRRSGKAPQPERP